MPHPSKRPCSSSPGCEYLEGECPKHGGSRKKKTANERGYTYRWQQYCIHYLRAHPLCVYCWKKGITKLAVVVDHIIPHRGVYALFWDALNHQALCKPCHDVKSSSETDARQRS